MRASWVPPVIHVGEGWGGGAGWWHNGSWPRPLLAYPTRQASVSEQEEPLATSAAAGQALAMSRTHHCEGRCLVWRRKVMWWWPGQPRAVDSGLADPKQTYSADNQAQRPPNGRPTAQGPPKRTAPGGTRGPAGRAPPPAPPRRPAGAARRGCRTAAAAPPALAPLELLQRAQAPPPPLPPLPPPAPQQQLQPWCRPCSTPRAGAGDGRRPLPPPPSTPQPAGCHRGHRRRYCSCRLRRLEAAAGKCTRRPWGSRVLLLRLLLRLQVQGQAY